MAYDHFPSCPHCWQMNESETYEESVGCEKCNHTGKRVLDMEILEQFSEMKQYIDEYVDSCFDLWQELLTGNRNHYSIKNYEVSGSTIYIEGYRYAGCNEYDYENFQMPTKYVLGSNPKGLIQADADEAKRKKEEEQKRLVEARRVQKIEEDKKKQLQQEEQDRLEYERLKAKFRD